MSKYTDGWRISGVQVEEKGTWKNTMTIDIECDDDEFERIRKGKTRISGMVYTYGLSQHPTQVGWFSFRADRDFDDDDDRDLEVVIENSFLNWNERYELHFTTRHGYSRPVHRSLQFTLNDDVKDTDFPPIVGLEVVGDVRPAKWRRVPEIAGKVKVRFGYEFGGKDAWFRVHHGNVKMAWWERLCRVNKRNRCAVWVPLKQGQNTVEVVPYDPGTGASGRVASVEVDNPHG